MDELQQMVNNYDVMRYLPCTQESGWVGHNIDGRVNGGTVPGASAMKNASYIKTTRFCCFSLFVGLFQEEDQYGRWVG